MNLKGQNILSTRQFDRKNLLGLFEEAKKMEKVIVQGGSNHLAGKIMATLFYEPSTRTRFSFEVAMQRLGGRVVSNADMMTTSSFTKMETLEDTGKVVSQMVDVIVMRHPEPGSVARLASKSDVPVINAGDGPAEHPTQALLDLYTIWKKFGKLDGLKIGMMGDLKNSRVQHSQVWLLKNFKVEFVLCSPAGLEMPKEILKEMKEAGLSYGSVKKLENLVAEADVISVTRIQKERFPSVAEYKKFAGLFILDANAMKKAKKNAIVIQPLPRVDEVTVEVDDDPRAKYFEQVGNGVAVRMALLKMVLGD